MLNKWNITNVDKTEGKKQHKIVQWWWVDGVGENITYLYQEKVLKAKGKNIMYPNTIFLRWFNSEIYKSFKIINVLNKTNLASSYHQSKNIKVDALTSLK